MGNIWTDKVESAMVNHLVDASKDFVMRSVNVVLALCCSIAISLTMGLRKMFTDEMIVNKLVHLRERFEKFEE